ncbi:ribosome maturation factor RimM [Acidihalobacter ferrooxydans]|nr:ribosome maturation factor RimM [Acidihalobacter ferrooxydans]
MGRIGGAFGVRGWLKVRSDTQPPEALLEYSPWQVQQGGMWRTYDVIEGSMHRKGLVVRLAGVTDREQAELLYGADIAVTRSQLESLPAGEYYWADLIGLRVMTTHGVELGELEKLIETGANDVLVVHGDRERLIPYLRPDVVTEIDLAAGVLRVDWDPEF